MVGGHGPNIPFARPIGNGGGRTVQNMVPFFFFFLFSFSIRGSVCMNVLHITYLSRVAFRIYIHRHTVDTYLPTHASINPYPPQPRV